MRSTITLALTALVLSVTSMALPLDEYSDLAERDGSFDLKTRMFDIEDFEAREYEFDELVARNDEPTTPTDPAPPYSANPHTGERIPGPIGPRPNPRPPQPAPSATERVRPKGPRPMKKNQSRPKGPRPVKKNQSRPRSPKRKLKRRAVYA